MDLLSLIILVFLDYPWLLWTRVDFQVAVGYVWPPCFMSNGEPPLNTKLLWLLLPSVALCCLLLPSVDFRWLSLTLFTWGNIVQMLICRTSFGCWLCTLSGWWSCYTSLQLMRCHVSLAKAGRRVPTTINSRWHHWPRCLRVDLCWPLLTFVDLRCPSLTLLDFCWLC